MSTENLVRGIHIVPLRDFVHGRYDEPTRQAIYESLSEDTRAMLESVSPDDWHPIRMVAEMYRGIYDVSGSPEMGYAELVKAGGAVAEYGVGTFMRLLIKLMTPEMLAKKWPTIWRKSHNFGRMETELHSDDARHLTLRLSEVDGYDHLGPSAVGFLSFALEAMGREEANVVERDVDYARRSAAEYVIDLSW